MRQRRVVKLHSKEDSSIQIVSQSVVLKNSSPHRSQIALGQESKETLREVRNLVENVERKLSVISKKNIVFAKQSIFDYVETARNNETDQTDPKL